jgi:hypothetical protein
MDLVALDDWGTVWKIAQPLIATYGPKVISWLYERYIKPKGGDAGFNPIDWNSGPLAPRHVTLQAGYNTEMIGVKDTGN